MSIPGDQRIDPISGATGNTAVPDALRRLALFGGRPAFPQPLHVGSPNIGDPNRIFDRIRSSIDRRWLTNHGPLVAEFEQAVARRCQVRNCIATCNATIALEVLYRALGLRGEVILPSFTFVATAHALEWQRITPVFADIEPGAFHLAPEDVVRRITARTSAIVGVHLWGHPCDIDRLQEIADAYEVPLLFDASHAFGCSYRQRPIGGFGTAEVFSFHATKFINALEGGAICTNDDSLAERCRRMINFGFAGPDLVVSEGTNGKMNEWSAAMGLTSLESMSEIVDRNRANFTAYQSGLERLPGLRLLTPDPRQRHNFQYVIVEVDARQLQLDRDTLARLLTAEGILARRYFTPGCHRMEPYRSRSTTDGSLPFTEQAARSTLALPTGTAMDVAQIARICELVAFIAAHGKEIRTHLPSPPHAFPKAPLALPAHGVSISASPSTVVR
jgi:dTDP-4-amino-4,6-dideoxygalactose transaminase